MVVLSIAIAVAGLLPMRAGPDECRQYERVNSRERVLARTAQMDVDVAMGLGWLHDPSTKATERRSHRLRSVEPSVPRHRYLTIQTPDASEVADLVRILPSNDCTPSLGHIQSITGVGGVLD